MAQVSYSRIGTFIQCPFRFKLRYIDKLETLPDDKSDNALYLGTAMHTGLEKDVETAIQQYFNNYPIITDLHINESIKLEYLIPKAKQMIPEGQFEVEINDPDFIGYMDLLVPVSDKVFDLYDFKYSNHKDRYLESEQLHLYKYFFEKNNPECLIRNMYYLMIPKTGIRQKKTEDLTAFRKRLRSELERMTPELVPVQYDETKVIRFLLNTKKMLEADTYPKVTGFLCRFCDYQEFCEKGEDYMLLPKNERRNLEGTKKKVIWIYGSPFSGKTTFANAFPDPLMLNTDGNYKFVDAPVLPIKDEITKNGRMVERKMGWEIFKEAINELELKENDFKTIIVDLLEDTYEMSRRYVCAERGWDHESDDSFKAWDMVRGEFLTTLKRLMGLDYENIILISHLDATKDITKKGGDKLTSIRPNINEKIANKVAGMVDIVARCVADDNKYVLSFKRNEVIFGGGRLKFNTEEIPLDYKAFCNLYGAAPVKVVEPVTVTKVNEEVPVTPTVEEVVAVEETEPRRRRRRAE